VWHAQYGVGRSVNYCKRYPRQTEKAQRPSGPGSYVDNPAANEWPAVIDADDDRASIPVICNTHLRAEWQRPVNRGECTRARMPLAVRIPE